MKISNISKRKFENLEPLVVPKNVTNTEAKMYVMDTNKGLRVVKKLHVFNGAQFANKLYTIEMLNEMKECLPSNIVIPDSLLSINGEINGFTMPFIEGKTLTTILKDKKVLPKTSIYYLKQIGFLLEQLKQVRLHSELKDFYINDLQDCNFIINNYGSLTVVDMDSCKIGTNNTAPARFLTSNCMIADMDYKYKRNTSGGLGYLEVNSDTDMYCYIITILNYLYGSNISNLSVEEYLNYIDYLDYLGFEKELLDTFKKVTYNCENENPAYLLDSITGEQVYRSGEKVYKINKK